MKVEVVDGLGGTACLQANEAAKLCGEDHTAWVVLRLPLLAPARRPLSHVV